MNFLHRLETALSKFLTGLGFGMRAKLISIFVIIKVIPLVLLTIVAWTQARHLGEELSRRTQEFQDRANNALAEMGEIAVEDSVSALNHLTTEQLERSSTDIAQRVAAFLYQRDNDILYAAGLEPGEAAYGHFIGFKKSPLIKQRKWSLAPDGKSWVPEEPLSLGKYSPSTNEENDTNYHNRPAELWETEDRPLYLEMTYVDLEGNELVKVTSSDQMDRRRKNVSNRLNTYVKAETYFAELKKLKPGEIYVSDVTGAYVRSRFIGMYTPENAASRGLEFMPEEEAYAGRENPGGRRFKGIIRWATPVTRNGTIRGYVTLALDHDHIMEFTDHITPMNERYVEMPSAYEGNYAFIWDYQCRSICHPRHHSIVGFNPDTGDPEIPWLEDRIYNEWQESGLPYTGFIQNVPVFQEQSRDKRPAPELTAAGLVGLDGRYLNNAPQCRGWYDLTAEGGSGSFLILWSGIWKPNTAATIPYYTGNYGKTKRGFGFVAIGAGLEDFQIPAKNTEKVLGDIISEANSDLALAVHETRGAIAENLLGTTVRLGISAGLMIILVVLIAIWMASVFTSSITTLIAGISRFRAGDRYFRFNSPAGDEIGKLSASFDEMADSLTETDQGPLVITDMDQKIIYVNEFGCTLMEKTKEEMEGQPYLETSLYPPNSVYDPITALKEGREAEIIFVPGLNSYLKGTASYLTDKEGKNIGYIINTTDVTEIIEQQKETAEQKVLLDTIFSASPDLIWYRDLQGNILAANPRYASLSGRKTGEIIGTMETDLIPAEHIPAYMETSRKVLEKRGPYYFEQRLEFADGHAEILDTVLTPVSVDGGNEITGILGFARNVSARVAIENELRKTQKELEKAVREANLANEHKSSFLARMSHEIRTPMNAIIGMTGIVKKKLGTEKFDLDDVNINIGQIEMSSQHLLNLLNDILDISKIEAGKIELSPEDVDLLKLSATVETIIRPRCEEKNVGFEVLFDIPPGKVYRADPLRLRQVLINLLGNAVKFTPEYGKIFFTVARREGGGGKALIDFFVRDTGIGIPDDAIDLLFRPFEQVSRDTSRKYGGTGLGLAISRSIVQLFGSDITVKSRLGKGSEFSFSLLFSESVPEKNEDIDIDNAEGRLKGKRALLVDDVAINRIIAINLLESTGLEIDEANDGDSALEIFKKAPEKYYDIIYMDVQMPRMNGYEAAEAIRALDRSDAKTVPIVALTANAFKEDIDRALASGMNAHLAKPMDPDRALELSLKLLMKGTG